MKTIHLRTERTAYASPCIADAKAERTGWGLGVAEGLTNDQIAERLGIAAGIAANHAKQILRRLSFRSRTQIGI